MNPNNIGYLRHGFAAALDAWTRNGVAPPPSRIPKIAAGTLVSVEKLAVASLHGVAAPKFAYNAYKIDFGVEPPPLRGTWTNLVPQIGPDGNELAGVRITNDRFHNRRKTRNSAAAQVIAVSKPTGQHNCVKTVQRGFLVPDVAGRLSKHIAQGVNGVLVAV